MGGSKLDPSIFAKLALTMVTVSNILPTCRIQGNRPDPGGIGLCFFDLRLEMTFNRRQYVNEYQDRYQSHHLDQ